MSGCQDDAPSSEDDASLYEAPEYSPLSGLGSPIAYSYEDEDIMSEESDHVSECQHEDLENESSMNTTSEQSQEDEPLWCGYIFVGDNMDKNVKPSRKGQEIKGKSLHYFHICSKRPGQLSLII